jgi:branched-chain amino acid transport system permease protein
VSFEDQLLQYVVSGLVVGSIYALIALGFVTIYNVTGIINFAQGEFAVFGAFLAITAFQDVRLLSGNVALSLGLPLPLAALVGVMGTTALGVGLYNTGIRAARKASILSIIIITIGAAFVLRGLALLVWGTDPFRLPVFSPGPPLILGGAILTRQSLWVVGATVILLLILYLFFNYTLLGKALRACAANPAAARLMGINTRRMSLLAFALSAAVTAIAGIVIVPSTFMTYDRGLTLSLKGFIAAAVGGMSSPTGAVVSGLLLGALESLGAGLLSSGYKDAVSFIVLSVVLAIRLGGLLRGRANVAEQAGL